MTQHSGFKVFMAAAVGAFIGSLVGLQFTPPLWWIGMFIGGAVGYLTYDFGTIVRSVPVAFRQARYYASRMSDVDYGRLARNIVPVSAVLGTVVVSGLLWFVPTVFIITYFAHHSFSLAYYFAAVGHVGGALVIGLATYFLIGSTIATATSGVAYDVPEAEQSRFFLTVLFFKGTPFGIVGYWIPKALSVAVPAIPHLTVLVALFLWRLFKLIHSDRRLLCGVDAAIGAAIGLFSHNPILGAAAGGTIGLLDYELVSKRWLKAIPA